MRLGNRFVHLQGVQVVGDSNPLATTIIKKNCKQEGKPDADKIPVNQAATSQGYQNMSRKSKSEKKKPKRMM